MTDKGKNKKQEKIQLLMQDVVSGDAKRLKKGLDGLRSNGDVIVLPELLEYWSIVTDEPTQKAIQQLFIDLKDSNAVSPIMECLVNLKDTSLQIKLLNTIWNTKVDFSEHLSTFVRLAVHGDLETAIECLTIIENLEGPFQEYQFLDAQVELSEFPERNEANTPKAQLISEIAQIIKDLESEHIEF
ncbi:MAG: hypothetical protein JJT77_11925 [Crocinitomicaceae bacterium]|nr:hypothetical protein [Crocinitomicaceae bacterium]